MPDPGCRWLGSVLRTACRRLGWLRRIPARALVRLPPRADPHGAQIAVASAPPSPAGAPPAVGPPAAGPLRRDLATSRSLATICRAAARGAIFVADIEERHWLEPTVVGHHLVIVTQAQRPPRA